MSKERAQAFHLPTLDIYCARMLCYTVYGKMCVYIALGKGAGVNS